MSAENDPIFIVGTGRSGSTLLRLMLCAHPRIYITHEASFYLSEKHFPRGRPRSEFLKHYFRTGSFRWLRLDPERLMAPFPDPLPDERIRDVFAAVMREKAAQYDRVRFGDKTPMHSFSLRRIFEHFPNARVIHIVRDPRATVLSLRRMPWAPESLLVCAAYWNLDYSFVEKFRSRVLRIRLEDLLREPRCIMQRVLDHVGEPWDEAALDHANNNPDTLDMSRLPWLESAKRERTGPSESWRTEFSPLQIRVIEAITGTRMKPLGYEPAVLDVEPSRPSVLWARLKEIPEVARLWVLWKQLQKATREADYMSSPEFNRLVRRLNPNSWKLYPGFDLAKAWELPKDLKEDNDGETSERAAAALTKGP